MKRGVRPSKASSSVVLSAVNPASTEATSSAVASPAAASTAPAVVTTMADPAVQECLSLVGQVMGKLGAHDPLNRIEIRHATKMRKGGAEVIPQILALCQQQNVTQIGSLTVQEMSDELKRGDALVQVGLQSALVQKAVKQRAMKAHGRSWQIGTTMYTTLQRLAVDDPDLADGLAPVQSFFQTKKTKGQVRKNKKAAAEKKLATQQEGVAPVAAEAHVSTATPAATPATPGAVP